MNEYRSVTVIGTGLDEQAYGFAGLEEHGGPPGRGVVTRTGNGCSTLLETARSGEREHYVNIY
jgi:hypothetical protein